MNFWGDKLSAGKTLLVLVVASLGLLESCRLQKSPVVSNRRSTKDFANRLIDPYSAAIERTSSFESLVVRFKTRGLAKCELKYWVTNNSAPPTREAPTTFACPSTNFKTEFYEVIKDVRADTLYSVEISAWQEGGNASSGEKLVVSEAKGEDGMDVIAVRFDAPLRTAEVHRHVFKTTEERGKLVESLKPPIGCKIGAASEARKQAGQADANVKVSKVASRGYASGQATKHPTDENRMQLHFQSVQPGDRWEWSYEFAGKSHVFLSRQAAEFKTLEMQAQEKKSFADPSLDVPDDPLAIDATKPLVFNWSSDAISDQSFVRVQIGQPGQSQPVTCWFVANKGTGSVEAEWLGKLSAGKNEVFVSLETLIWQDAVAAGGPPWILATYDWRLGQVNKP